MRQAYLYCLLFWLAVCETAVDVDVPRSPAQITVNALFNPDSVWLVELSKNRYILDNNRFEGLPEATVEIWQGEQFVVRLAY